MKIVFAALLSGMLLAVPAMAHTLFMNINDNEDGTACVEGVYSTGAVASITEVRLETSEGKMLLKGKTNADGEFQFDKPDQPYMVILDGGPGHVCIGEGPR